MRITHCCCCDRNPARCASATRSGRRASGGRPYELLLWPADDLQQQTGKTCALLQVHDCQDIGPHYAVTLRAWRAAWEARKTEVLKLGHSERFWRKYRYEQQSGKVAPDISLLCRPASASHIAMHRMWHCRGNVRCLVPCHVQVLLCILRGGVRRAVHPHLPGPVGEGRRAAHWHGCASWRNACRGRGRAQPPPQLPRPNDAGIFSPGRISALLFAPSAHEAEASSRLQIQVAAAAVP